MVRSAESYAKLLETSRNWKAKNPERHAELAVAYRARNREKTRAQNQLNYAIRKGRMERLPCEVCKTDQNVQAHHHDYTLPFDVKWLCIQCHKDAHPVDDEDKRVKFAKAKRARLPGSMNPNASLDDATVRMIRLALDLGLSQESIGRVFGISQVGISRIERGETYSNVT